MRPLRVSEPVLDSSAILALVLGEPGARKVQEHLPGALLSAVNYAEAVSKLSDRGMPPDEARMALGLTGVSIVDFDSHQAWLAGDLRRSTRSAGLSLGDRACLALARDRSVPAITADRLWAQIPGFDVVVIR